MKRRSRRISRLSAVPVVVLLLLGPALTATAQDTCQGKAITKAGTAGDDQLIGGPANDVINGGDGDDVIKGFGGDDTICGGNGNDGINGGDGGDSLFGGDGHDLIMGAGGWDSLEGGVGNDAVYGGDGNDSVMGGTLINGAYTDGENDFLMGNADSDTTPPNTGDVWYADGVSSNPTCYPDFARRMGTYKWDRLVPQTGSCVTISGQVTGATAAGDGDYTFDVVFNGTLYKVEFMPRDRGVGGYPAVSNGSYVTVSGLRANDSGHGGWAEIHPVFFLREGGGNTSCGSAHPCYYSGPGNGGSPFRLSPESQRFCWKENGEPCSQYGTQGTPFA